MNKRESMIFTIKTLQALKDAHGDKYNYVVLAVDKETNEGIIACDVDDETFNHYINSIKTDKNPVEFLTITEDSQKH